MALRWFAKKRILVIILLIFGVLYFSLPSARLPSASELTHPEYALLPPDSKITVREPVLPPQSPGEHSKSIFPKTPVFLPSFFATSPILKDLLSSGAHYARLISTVLEQQSSLYNSTRFNCICGRVSDACVCCGSLSIPTEMCKSVFPSRLCVPLVHFSTVESGAANFCLNVTYLPKKQHVNTAGFLIPQTSQSASGGPTDPSPRQLPHPEHTLVLFDSQILSVTAPPVVCVENSRTDPELAICVQLSELRYFYDTGSDHKTVFAGCAEVSVLLRRQFILTRSAQFCFRAHRGAAGDVDQASVLAQKDEKTKNEEKALAGNKPDAKLSPETPASRSKSKNADSVPFNSSTKPVLEQADSKKVPGSLDAHDAIQVVP